MEQGKFQNNSKLFLFGIFCLVVSLGLLFFCLYLLPYFFWELRYTIPDFILSRLATLQDDQHYTSAGSKAVVWFTLFIPGVITGLISYFVSHYIDKNVYGIGTPPAENESKLTATEIKKDLKESAGIGMQIIGLMVVIVIVILLLQYFVQSTA